MRQNGTLVELRGTGSVPLWRYSTAGRKGLQRERGSRLPLCYLGQIQWSFAVFGVMEYRPLPPAHISVSSCSVLVRLFGERHTRPPLPGTDSVSVL